MPDEVIAGLNPYGGGAHALPLFSFRHMFCNQVMFGLVALSFETHR
jgi:hypothetical protein